MKIDMNEKTAAIILAAGSGKRMQSDVPKQFLKIKGKSLLLYSVEQFAKVTDRVIVVTSEAMLRECQMIIKEQQYPFTVEIIAGGKERYDSSMAGIEAAKDCSYVMIHDAARACITQEVIENSLDSAKKYGSGVAAVAVKDTIKKADASGFVEETLERNSLRIIQTPQTFRYDWIADAYAAMQSAESLTAITDDAMVLETFGNKQVYLSNGDYKNIKVTTPEDLILAELFLPKEMKCNSL